MALCNTFWVKSLEKRPRTVRQDLGVTTRFHPNWKQDCHFRHGWRLFLPAILAAAFAVGKIGGREAGQGSASSATLVLPRHNSLYCGHAPTVLWAHGGWGGLDAWMWDAAFWPDLR